jgi:hypothetical protein
MNTPNPINSSGKDMESLRKQFLIKHSIPFKAGKTHTIDFEILTTPTIWIECTNQNVEGSAMEKIPNKIIKYHLKRGINEIYIERGSKAISKDVLRSIDWIESKSDIKVHIVTTNQMNDILLGIKVPKNKFF